MAFEGNTIQNTRPIPSNSGKVSANILEAMISHQSSFTPIEGVDELENLIFYRNQIQALSETGWAIEENQKFEKNKDGYRDLMVNRFFRMSSSLPVPKRFSCTELKASYHVKTLWGSRPIQRFNIQYGWQFDHQRGERIEFRDISLWSMDWHKAIEEKIERNGDGQIETFTTTRMFPHGIERGLSGIRVADFILKHGGVVGVLIGSQAREIWRETDEPLDIEQLRSHRDTDVLVVNGVQEPIGMEGGIDWFNRDHRTSRPTNGMRQTYLNADIILNESGVVFPGLCLPPRSLVVEWEKRILANGGKVKQPYAYGEKPRLKDYPVLPDQAFSVKWYL